MEIVLLGTGAGEGYPGRWCECPHCAYARAHGGRNLRTNSCALVNGDLLLDMGPGCFDSAARLGISLAQITGLCITHSHADHLFPQELRWRGGRINPPGLTPAQTYQTLGPRFTAIPTLRIYGSAVTKAALERQLQNADWAIHYETLSPGPWIRHGSYEISAIAAEHGEPGGTYTYRIRQSGKTLLYALDTGGYAPRMLEHIARQPYDLVVMEGTGGLRTGDTGHMNLEKNRAFRKFLLERGCIQPATPFVLSHMSPHWTPPYDQYRGIAEKHGFLVGYDGLRLAV